MRKTLALVLAIMMLLGATLPVAAREIAGVSGVFTEQDDPNYVGKAKFDYTSKNDFLNGADLVVTEVCFDSSVIRNGISPDENCFNFIEIYNRGDEAFDLKNLGIVGIVDKGNYSYWDQNGDFNYKPSDDSNGERAKAAKALRIIPADKAGNDYGIYDPSVTGMDPGSAKNRHPVMKTENPADMEIQPGEFAIIWLIVDAVYTASKTLGSSLTDSADGRAPFSQFRDHYAKKMGFKTYVDPDADEPVFTPEMQRLENTLIVAAYAATTMSEKLNTLAFRSDECRIYALVDYSQGGFSYEEDLVDTSKKHNPKIISYFGWGVGDRHGIMGGVQDATTIYVPSMSTPDFQNKLDKMDDENAVPAVDYVHAGIANSYLEMAVMSASQTATIGSMPSYQWRYVDEQAMLDKVDGYNKNVDGSDSDLEDSFVNTLAYISDWGKSWSTAVNTSIQNADGTLKTGDSVIDTENPENTYLNWKDGSIDALIEISIQVNEDYEYVSSEILNEMTFVNKDYWLNQQGSNINYDPAAGTTTTQKSGGLSTPVLIAIIAGGVVVLAAVVVVVIVVSKKKKAVAIDDVAAEGDVEVIDETAEAPADKTEE